jgi:plastocyanin
LASRLPLRSACFTLTIPISLLSITLTLREDTLAAEEELVNFRVAITETATGDEDMRHKMLLLVSAMVAASAIVGCGSDSTTAPGGGGTPPAGGGTPPGGGTGGTPSPAPSTAAVSVGDIFFKSGHNGSSNPAVDTVPANGAVTWTWAASLPHSIQSTGSPGFTSSQIQAGAGKTYQLSFATPGTYQYDCAVHGQAMTGRIVVVAATAATPSSTTTPTPVPPGY